MFFFFFNRLKFLLLCGHCITYGFELFFLMRENCRNLFRGKVVKLYGQIARSVHHMLPAFTDEECCKEVAFVLMLQAYGRTFVPSIPISGKASEEERQETLFLMQAISSGKWNCFITHGAVLEFLISRVYRRSDADCCER